MTATNHALSGALIGLAITQPVIALPLALVSHFMLDSVPHFGIKFAKSPEKRKLFHRYLLIDACLLTLIIIGLFLAGAGWLVFACLFLAGCPDFYQAYHYIANKKFHKTGQGITNNAYTRFHKNIQVGKESEKGIFVEAPLAIIFIVIIAKLL